VTATLEQAESVLEISSQASEQIASWRRVLNQTVGDARPNLERAAVELLRLAQIEPGSKQIIVDELANLALIHPTRSTAAPSQAKMHWWHSLCGPLKTFG